MRLPLRHSLAVALALAWASPGRAQDTLVATAAAAPPVEFLHDRFRLEIASEFAAASFPINGRLPGDLGLGGEGLSARLGGVAYRQNAVPFQAGEYYAFGGSGAELGLYADRRLWEAEPLGHPPSGADDPALGPGPADSVFFTPVPLFGYAASELSFWRDPVLPDSARATASYTNGPAGYSHTGGRLRSELGAGLETDLQVFRVFSDGLAEPSHFEGHAFDLELRRRLGKHPTRLRLRQNRGTRDLVYRWQVDPRREEHRYYLTHLDFEVALPGARSEWLAAYHLRVADQLLQAPQALAASAYWFERTHRFGLSRVAVRRWAVWAGAWAEYREGDSESNLASAWASELEAGLRGNLAGLRILASLGTRFEEQQTFAYRAALAAHWPLDGGHHLLAFGGRSREVASTLRRFLSDSGATHVARGRADLPSAEHATSAVAWRYEGGRVGGNVMLSASASDALAEWQPAGDTSVAPNRFEPVPTDRSALSLFCGLRLKPWDPVEVSGSWRRLWLQDGTQASAFSPENCYWVALRLPVEQPRIRLRVTPEVAVVGATGGTLPEEAWSVSLGVVATLKQLSVFWFRDNVRDETLRTGGAWPGYGRHSRFGFRWDFWN